METHTHLRTQFEKETKLIFGLNINEYFLWLERKYLSIINKTADKCNVSVCEPVGEALPEIITQIKKFEQEALKQAAFAERDSCIESQMTSEAMAFAYRLCYELIEGSKH